MRRIWILVGIAIVVTLVALIALTAVLVPDMHPAYDAAMRFTDAVLDTRDDAVATTLLTPKLAAWVAESCPDGVSACVNAYIPAEWGNFVDAVYRRSIPDGPAAWDILAIATYDERLTAGFSGVCIYLRAENLGGDDWRVARWSGWVSCGNDVAALEQLRTSADAPNRAP